MVSLGVRRAHHRALLEPAWTPRKLGAALVLWLAADRSPLSLSTASYAGSGTITQTGTTVTGSLSSFLGQVAVGDTLTADAGDPLISGTVTAIASATSLTLDTSVEQAVGQAYTVFPVAGSTDRVTQINDLSGRGNHASQATQANKPVYRAGANGIGGRAALSFDGTNDVLAADGVAAFASGSDVPLTVAVVAATTNGASSPVLVGWGLAANNTSFHRLRTDSPHWILNRRDDAASAVSLTASGDTNDTNPHVFVHVYAGTVADLWDNGANVVAAGAMDVGTTTLDQFSVGSARGSSAILPLAGNVAEVIVCNRALTPSERRHVEIYLGRHYGITV